MVRKNPKGPAARAGAGWWWLPALTTLLGIVLVGALVLRWIALPPALPTFSLFIFSDFAHMKVWLATVILVLALFQLLWAARIYGLVRFPPRDRFFQVLHRSSGWVILALTLPIAYHCIILVTQTPLDARVIVHTTLGAFVYGAIATKVTLVRRRDLPGWLLPVVGGLLFTIFAGLWLTSVPWFVRTYGISL